MSIEYKQIISDIERGSPAAKAKLKVGDSVLSINNEPIIDFIDDNYFNTLEELHIDYINHKNQHKTVVIHKGALTPLGIHWENNLYPDEKHCHNRCLFCFVDQLPANMRSTMYLKDDDWRYSIAFGNYVTLTNVTDDELDRIIRRKASPLYVSVHAVNPEVRHQLMLNPQSKMIQQQLEKLVNAGIVIHAQIVMCPGINDQEVLDESIQYLASLYPGVRTLAVVPVGLTGHRADLPKLQAVDQTIAERTVHQIETYRKEFTSTLGIPFVYASDEFYSRAQLPYPLYHDGHHNPQISNGVGMFSEFIQEFNQAMDAFSIEIEKMHSDRRIAILSGTSAQPQLRTMIQSISKHLPNAVIEVISVSNNLFGESVTVSGLLSGMDMYTALKDLDYDVIMIPDSTLSQDQKIFLDNMTPDELSMKLNTQIIVQPVDGYEFVASIIKALRKDA